MTFPLSSLGTIYMYVATRRDFLLPYTDAMEIYWYPIKKWKQTIINTVIIIALDISNINQYFFTVIDYWNINNQQGMILLFKNLYAIDVITFIIIYIVYYFTAILKIAI